MQFSQEIADEIIPDINRNFSLNKNLDQSPCKSNRSPYQKNYLPKIQDDSSSSDSQNIVTKNSFPDIPNLVLKPRKSKFSMACLGLKDSNSKFSRAKDYSHKYKSSSKDITSEKLDIINNLSKNSFNQILGNENHVKEYMISSNLKKISEDASKDRIIPKDYFKYQNDSLNQLIIETKEHNSDYVKISTPKLTNFRRHVLRSPSHQNEKNSIGNSAHYVKFDRGPAKSSEKLTKSYEIPKNFKSNLCPTAYIKKEQKIINKNNVQSQRNHFMQTLEKREEKKQSPLVSKSTEIALLKNKNFQNLFAKKVLIDNVLNTSSINKQKLPNFSLNNRSYNRPTSNHFTHKSNDLNNSSKITTKERRSSKDESIDQIFIKDYHIKKKIVLDGNIVDNNVFRTMNQDSSLSQKLNHQSSDSKFELKSLKKDFDFKALAKKSLGPLHCVTNQSNSLKSKFSKPSKSLVCIKAMEGKTITEMPNLLDNNGFMAGCLTQKNESQNNKPNKGLYESIFKSKNDTSKYPFDKIKTNKYHTPKVSSLKIPSVFQKRELSNKLSDKMDFSSMINKLNLGSIRSSFISCNDKKL